MDAGRGRVWFVCVRGYGIGTVSVPCMGLERNFPGVEVEQRANYELDKKV